jgi:heat shock protein HslJ
MNRTRMISRIWIRWLTLTAGLLLITACTIPQIEVTPSDPDATPTAEAEPEPETPAPGSPLESTVWLLEEYINLEGEMQAALEGSDGFILLENGELGGTAGCNSFFSEYTLEDETLAFGTIGSTLMACDEPLMSQERAVFNALESTAAFEIDADTLTLLDADGNTLAIFHASPTDTLPIEGETPEIDDPDMDEAEMDEAEMDEPEAATLEDTRWQLTHYAVDGELLPAVEDAEAYLEMSNGQLLGRTGCNQFGGSDYTLDDENLRFGPVESTLIGCPDPLAQQEQGFFAGMAAAETYTLENNTLTLNDADGAPRLVFVAGPAPDAEANMDVADTDVAAALDSEGVVETEIDTEPSLEGFTWALVAYRDRHGEWVEPVSTGELRLGGGNLTGHTGCNNMNSAYNTEDDRLSFGVIATTRMGCAPDIAAQEFAVLDALRQVAGYELDNDTLTLVDSEGEALLEFGVPEE